MNYKERQAAVAQGRYPFEFQDYWDLSKLIVIFVSLAGCCWILFPNLADHITAFLFCSLFCGGSFLAIYLFWHTAKLEVVHEDLISMRIIRDEISDMGYEVSFIDDFHLHLTRRISWFRPTTCVRIFAHEGRILGCAWMDGGRYNRMPFVTGRSQIRAIREKLQIRHPAVSNISAAPVSKDQARLASHRRTRGKNRW